MSRDEQNTDVQNCEPIEAGSAELPPVSPTPVPGSINGTANPELDDVAEKADQASDKTIPA
jgi:hypothetical protein